MGQPVGRVLRLRNIYSSYENGPRLSVWDEVVTIDRSMEALKDQLIDKEQLTKQQLVNQYTKLRKQGLTVKQAIQHSRRGIAVQLPGSAGGLWNEGTANHDIPQNILDMLLKNMDIYADILKQ